MSNERAGPETISSVPELLAHAYQIEIDALERYHMLADQMEVHNNPELADLFRKLAGHEERHAKEILARAGEMTLPTIAMSAFKWGEAAEGPETAAIDEAHYLMTPWHALQMALAAEKRAHGFFSRLADAPPNAAMKRWAEEFREEEAEHVRYVEALLQKYPEPPADWADDMDPPVYPE